MDSEQIEKLVVVLVDIQHLHMVDDEDQEVMIDLLEKCQPFLMDMVKIM